MAAAAGRLRRRNPKESAVSCLRLHCHRARKLVATCSETGNGKDSRIVRMFTAGAEVLRSQAQSECTLPFATYAAMAVGTTPSLFASSPRRARFTRFTVSKAHRVRTPRSLRSRRKNHLLVVEQNDRPDHLLDDPLVLRLAAMRQRLGEFHLRSPAAVPADHPDDGDLDLGVLFVRPQVVPKAGAGDLGLPRHPSEDARARRTDLEVFVGEDGLVEFADDESVADPIEFRHRLQARFEVLRPELLTEGGESGLRPLRPAAATRGGSTSKT